MLQKTVLVLVTIVTVYGYTPPAGQTVGVPWPMPKEYRSTKIVQTLNEGDFTFNVGDLASCDIIASAIERYYHLIFRADRPNVQQKETANSLRFSSLKESAQLKGLDIVATSGCETYPSLQTDESCNMAYFFFKV